MSIKKYTVLSTPKSNNKIKPGDIVYECVKCDYGCAADDSQMTGVHHISISLSPTGDYPFFTIPAKDLEEIQDV